MSFTPSFFKSLRRMTSPYRRFWGYIRYDIPYGIKNLIRFAPLVWNHRDWGFSSIERMMEFQLKLLLKNISKNGQEVDEFRIPKENDMKRCLEILENRRKDDTGELMYAEKCGWKNDGEITFVPTEDGMFELKVEGRTQTDTEAGECIRKGHELEQQELEELYNLLKNSPGWWD